MGLDTTFIDELSSGAPTPGGGGAAAYCGALASALASMVGNLTVGKKRYADVEDQVRQAMDELEELRGELLCLIDEDAQAFGALAATWRMPKETKEQQQEKVQAEQAALQNACDVPLRIMAACSKVIVLCAFMARNGSRMAVSDAGCAALFAQAALEAASLNILINAPSFTDETQAKTVLAKQQALIDNYAPIASETYAYVRKELA